MKSEKHMQSHQSIRFSYTKFGEEKGSDHVLLFSTLGLPSVAIVLMGKRELVALLICLPGVVALPQGACVLDCRM